MGAGTTPCWKKRTYNLGTHYQGRINIIVFRDENNLDATLAITRAAYYRSPFRYLIEYSYHPNLPSISCTGREIMNFVSKEIKVGDHVTKYLSTHGKYQSPQLDDFLELINQDGQLNEIMSDINDFMGSTLNKDQKTRLSKLLDDMFTEVAQNSPAIAWQLLSEIRSPKTYMAYRDDNSSAYRKINAIYNHPCPQNRTALDGISVEEREREVPASDIDHINSVGNHCLLKDGTIILEQNVRERHFRGHAVIKERYVRFTHVISEELEEQEGLLGLTVLNPKIKKKHVVCYLNAIIETALNSLTSILATLGKNFDLYQENTYKKKTKAGHHPGHRNCFFSINELSTIVNLPPDGNFEYFHVEFFQVELRGLTVYQVAAYEEFKSRGLTLELLQTWQRCDSPFLVQHLKALKSLFALGFDAEKAIHEIYDTSYSTADTIAKGQSVSRARCYGFGGDE